MLYSVITTINEPSECVSELAAKHQEFNLTDIIIVGDKKGPSQYDLRSTALLSIDKQLEKYNEIANLIPYNHYARKNIGYLHAMHAGASAIYETDDDNAPTERWRPRPLVSEKTHYIITKAKWVNIYKYFTSEDIWPRGLPINQSNRNSEMLSIEKRKVFAPIQQGLVNRNPDVDAVWRLTNDVEFFFQLELDRSIAIPEYTWSPFNSQSTWWHSVAFPLLYIPSFCSFRMCDIWRGFIAQRCLWELGYQLVYHPVEVKQDRNPHDNLADLKDEMPGMQFNDCIVDILAKIPLKPGAQNISRNLLACYQCLVHHGLLPKEELDPLRAWLEELKGINIR